jgi:hypothetical protein
MQIKIENKESELKMQLDAFARDFSLRLPAGRHGSKRQL